MDISNSLKIIDNIPNNTKKVYYIRENIKNELNKNDNFNGDIIIDENIQKEIFTNKNDNTHVIILYDAYQSFKENPYYDSDIFYTPKSFINEDLLNDISNDSIRSDISYTDNVKYNSNINVLLTNDRDSQIKEIISKIVNIERKENRRYCNCVIL